MNVPDHLNDSAFTLMPDHVPTPHEGVRTQSQIEQKVSLESVVEWQETFRPVYLEIARVLPGVSKEEFKTSLFRLMKDLASQHGTGAFRDDPTQTAAVQGTGFGRLGLHRELCQSWRDLCSKVRAWMHALDAHFETRGVPNTFWRPEHLAGPKTVAEVNRLRNQYQVKYVNPMVHLYELNINRPLLEDGSFMDVEVWKASMQSTLSDASMEGQTPVKRVSPWANWGASSSNVPPPPPGPPPSTGNPASASNAAGASPPASAPTDLKTPYFITANVTFGATAAYNGNMLRDHPETGGTLWRLSGDDLSRLEETAREKLRNSPNPYFDKSDLDKWLKKCANPTCNQFAYAKPPMGHESCWNKAQWNADDFQNERMFSRECLFCCGQCAYQFVQPDRLRMAGKPEPESSIRLCDPNFGPGNWSLRGRYHYAHCSCNDAAKPYDSWLAIGHFTRTNDGKLAVEHFVRDNMRRINAGEFTGLVKTRLQPKASAQPATGNPASGEVPVKPSAGSDVSTQGESKNAETTFWTKKSFKEMIQLTSVSAHLPHKGVWQDFSATDSYKKQLSSYVEASVDAFRYVLGDLWNRPECTEIRDKAKQGTLRLPDLCALMGMFPAKKSFWGKFSPRQAEFIAKELESHGGIISSLGADSDNVCVEFFGDSMNYLCTPKDDDLNRVAWESDRTLHKITSKKSKRHNWTSVPPEQQFLALRQEPGNPFDNWTVQRSLIAGKSPDELAKMYIAANYELAPPVGLRAPTKFTSHDSVEPFATNFHWSDVDNKLPRFPTLAVPPGTDATFAILKIALNDFAPGCTSDRNHSPKNWKKTQTDISKECRQALHDFLAVIVNQADVVLLISGGCVETFSYSPDWISTKWDKCVQSLNQEVMNDFGVPTSRGKEFVEELDMCSSVHGNDCWHAVSTKHSAGMTGEMMTMMLKLCRVYVPCKKFTTFIDGIAELIDKPTATVTTAVNVESDSSTESEHESAGPPVSAEPSEVKLEPSEEVLPEADFGEEPSPDSVPLMKDWAKEEAKEEVKEEPGSDEDKDIDEAPFQVSEEVRQMAPMSPLRTTKEEPSSSAGTVSAPLVPLVGSIAAATGPTPFPTLRGRHSDIRNRDPPRCSYTWSTACYHHPDVIQCGLPVNHGGWHECIECIKWSQNKSALWTQREAGNLGNDSAEAVVAASGAAGVVRFDVAIAPEPPALAHWAQAILDAEPTPTPFFPQYGGTTTSCLTPEGFVQMHFEPRTILT
ncbi:MAG: hypothetical protein NZ577_02785, partial [Vicinamibacterales bacterium]|nr:hypothetical protein [Vicinamibacterales bacterium]